MQNNKTVFIAMPSCNNSVAINFSQSQNISYVAQDSVNLIANYGAIPLIVPSNIGLEHIKDIASFCDGLMLLGGPDISADFYGKKVKDTVVHGPVPDLARDTFELALYNAFYDLGKPVLGICRGMQLINVAHKGSLIQDLHTSLKHYIEPDGWINYHEINIVNGTKVRSLLQCDSYVTSSVHHQGIDRLGAGLQVSAYSEDGVPEIIESNDANRFVIGIQGHPEKTRTNLKKYEKIFSEFIKLSGENDE